MDELRGQIDNLIEDFGQVESISQNQPIENPAVAKQMLTINYTTNFREFRASWYF
jgi:hypothetical protein